ADHDFTKTGIIPSVAMICDIPESINIDFYAGKVCIGLKDPIFQPSSPLRHATELYSILLEEQLVDKPSSISDLFASEIEMEKFWETIQLVDDSVTHEDHTAEHIKQRLFLQEFIEHCCTARHYSFTIKKCGESTCTICRLPCCLPEDFEQLHRLLDPVPGDDLHYKSFEELYGKQTTEDHRPSLKNKPCLLFSAKKLSEKDKTILQGFLDTILYTCGMSFYNTYDLAIAIPPKQDICDDITEDNVFVNDSWSCSSPIEKPYYSAGIYPDVCIECGSLDVNRVTKDEHPHCSGCNSDTIVSKKRLKWKQGGSLL
ncbi:6397_t:CDS:2, partial [Rhizophagus irregularis]